METILRTFMDAVEKYNGAITAIATIVVAAFTIVLARVTGRQARLTAETIKLAREEFASSHRPRIILRDVCIDGMDVLYMLVNTGGTKATIIESWIMVEFIAEGAPIRPLRSFSHDELGPLIFAAGEVKDLIYPLPAEIGVAVDVPGIRRIGIGDRPPVFGNGHFYFTGA